MRSYRSIIYILAITITFPIALKGADALPKEFATELNGRNLNLDLTGQYKRFFFSIDIQSLKDGKRIKLCDILVSHDKRNSAVLVRYADGLPYCFFSNNLLLIRDSKAGVFRAFQAGMLNFELRFNRGNGAELVIGMKSAAAEAKCTLDAKSFVYDPGVTDATFDTATKTALWKIGNSRSPVEVQSTTKLEFNMDPNAHYPIQTLTFDSPKAPLLVIGHFVVDEPAPIDLHVPILQKLKAANFEVNNLEKEDIKNVQIFPNTPKLDASNERAVAITWSSFFQPPKK